MITEWHGLDLTPRYCRDNERMLKLRSAGAVHEKREDSHGDTHAGWWLDGVFLGEDVKTALSAITGD